MELMFILRMPTPHMSEEQMNTLTVLREYILKGISMKIGENPPALVI